MAVLLLADQSSKLTGGEDWTGADTRRESADKRRAVAQRSAGVQAPNASPHLSLTDVVLLRHPSSAAAKHMDRLSYHRGILE
jgi:hypothetical protein